MDYYNNIKQLIEKNLIEIKKNEMHSNCHTLTTYYNIGKEIVEAQGGEKRAKYGNALIKEFSNKLTNEYGKGYDISNLRRMRLLYLTFKKGGTLSHQLSWSHYYVLLPIKDDSNLIIVNTVYSLLEMLYKIFSLTKDFYN